MNAKKHLLKQLVLNEHIFTSNASESSLYTIVNSPLVN